MTKEAKSPFELRMDMITTAKEILERQFEINYDIAKTTYEIARESAKALKDVLPAAPEFPKYPTFEEITALAQKMNVFVSGK